MSTENSEVKEIPIIPPVVLEAASRGELVMFIGAGVSRILGCPSWKDLAIFSLTELYEKNLISYFEFERLQMLDPRKLLSICINIAKQRNIRIPFEEYLEPKSDLTEKFGNIYEYIYSAGVIYVTTNFDNLLDKEFEKNKERRRMRREETLHDNKKEIIYEKENLLVSKLVLGNIIHLHGGIKRSKELIITVGDYLRHYKNEEVITFLEEIFSKYLVLFIGYGLEEFEILEFLVHKARPVSKEIKHFMLYPVFRQEKDMIKFYKTYYAELGIELIPYAIDKKGYEQLYYILKEWSQEIRKYAKRKDYLREIRLIDEVVK